MRAIMSSPRANSPVVYQVRVWAFSGTTGGRAQSSCQTPAPVGETCRTFGPSRLVERVIQWNETSRRWNLFSVWALNHLVNPPIRALMKSRFGRLLGANLVLIGYRGKQSGLLREVPVGFVADGPNMLVLVGHADGKRWWRNMRGGADVDLHVEGRELTGHAVALEGRKAPAAVAAALGRFVAANPSARRSFGLDAEAWKNEEALLRAADELVLVTISRNPDDVAAHTP